MNDVIDTFVGKGKQFTAFDATQEGKNQGTDERHGLLKGTVHARWADGSLQGQGYTRQTIQIPGVNIDPWLYFPASSDPQDYVNDIANEDEDDDYIEPPGGGSIAGTLAPPVSSGVAVPPTAGQNARTVSHNYKRRLSLGKTLVKHMGADPGDEILVKHNSAQNQLVVGAANSVFHYPGKVVANMHVAQEKRIRLNPLILKLISQGDDFNVLSEFYKWNDSGNGSPHSAFVVVVTAR